MPTLRRVIQYPRVAVFGLALTACAPPAMKDSAARTIIRTTADLPAEISGPQVRRRLLDLVKEVSITDECMTLVVRSDGISELHSTALARLFPNVDFFRVKPTYGPHPPRSDCSYPGVDAWMFSAAIDRSSGEARTFTCVTNPAPFARLASSAHVVVRTLGEAESFGAAFTEGCDGSGFAKAVEERVSEHSWRLDLSELNGRRSYYELTTDEHDVVKTFEVRAEDIGR